jgi:hypothetical protein
MFFDADIIFIFISFLEQLNAAQVHILVQENASTNIAALNRATTLL